LFPLITEARACEENSCGAGLTVCAGVRGRGVCAGDGLHTAHQLTSHLADRCCAATRTSLHAGAANTRGGKAVP